MQSAEKKKKKINIFKAINTILDSELYYGVYAF